MKSETAHSEVGRITRLVLKHARDAFVDQATIDAQWKTLNFTAPPDFRRAVGEYDRFVDLLARSGASIQMLPRGDQAGLDSLYVRDASVVCDRGLILCNMGKALRAWEPAAHERALRESSLPIVGAIRGPGRLEGGDVVWLGDRAIAVGRGYRTNDEGIRQLRRLLADEVDQFIVVSLPHWRGPGDVFHLMSIVSPVDRDLGVVYSRLLPVPFREWLMGHGYRLVEVPDEEFDTMATNVLAIAPRTCVMLSGNPRTRAALEAVGATVLEYEGREISLKGGGGPTCLTRPLRRALREAPI
ncbi:MAG: hypothetical protein HY654_13660 [Acidobacteria bacterium]|nr:hypothetical protein [Acidobacteriota bacterium]